MWIMHATIHVNFLRMRDELHTASMTGCVCVRTMCSALAEQCSVQFRSEQRRPRPVQPQYPGNPYVFRSPGPYLMSLSKKKVALSMVCFSLSLSVSPSFSFCLSLFYSPSFSHAPPPRPLEPLCEWMDSKCLLSNSACPSVLLRISSKRGR